MYVCMLTPAGFSPSWAPLYISRWLFKQSSILLFWVFPVWNFGSKFEERSCENAVVLSFYQTYFRSFTTSQEQLELTYITYKAYCLSIVHVHTLALIEMTLCRTLWRISWTPKSGHTSPSVQPPGMDPAPSGMLSEPALHFLRSYQVCWHNWMTADADTLAFSKYFASCLTSLNLTDESPSPCSRKSDLSLCDSRPL